MAKLEDIETKGNQPIIWIDDPISSLDANHIFFIYSLINAEIVKPEKYEDGGEIKERDRFKQLFISTHNLDFLKYLKRLPGVNNDERKKEAKRKSSFLIIEREDKASIIRRMPNYLRDYVTEFNYLFEQIFKCASINTVDDSNYTTFYNFGNNARKFFEIYLYYKFPDKGMTEDTLELFFGDERIPAVLTDRINNEYSHLAGIFERGSTPVEVPEMQTAAKLILQKIEERDRNQYSALLQSIGVTEEPAEELQTLVEVQ
jgi:wobble nucleotide-excising tRNase